MMMKSEETVKPSGAVEDCESTIVNQDGRDDVSSQSKVIMEEREKAEATIKKPQLKTLSRKQKSSGGSHPSPHPSPQVSGYPSFHQHGAPGRAGYHPGMHGQRGPPPSSAPFPPPYYTGGAPHDYRGPLPHHYLHQMPPMPHPSQGAYPGAHYAPNLAGRPGPPPGYHHGYGVPYPGPPAMGYHGAPPPYPQTTHAPHLMQSSTSDSASIASSKSKRSTKSSRKKRTIDGVHASKDTNPPVAYTFCRTNSNVSASTVATAPNVSESHTMGDESPYKRERTGEKTSNIFDEERFIHRNFSNTSTTSSVSVGGFSFSSFDGHKLNKNDNRLMKASPKRRKAEHLTVETGSNIKSIFKKKSGAGIDASKFQQLTMNDSSGSEKSGENTNGNIFLSLSTSPIDQAGEEEPVKTNTAKKESKPELGIDPMEEETNSDNMASPKKPLHDRSTDTPTLTIIAGDAALLTDEHVLNKHLRGQSFTPLPHLADHSGTSPSNGFQSIGPQLSWSIAGDAPSLEDLATCSWEETEKDEKKRPGSTTSQLSSASRALVISPHNFSLWKDEHETGHPKRNEEMKDSDSVRISMLSPHSEIAMAVEGVGGTTTPLPWSFEASEERENRRSGDKRSKQDQRRHNVFSSAHKPQATPGAYMWTGPAPPTPVFTGSKPPTPHFSGSFARSPLHCDRRDWFGHMTPGPHDRVRNLRGRVPHGSHLAPMPLHIPPSMASHHPLTSPMGIGHKAPMWSPHGNMPSQMASPHPHMSPALDMSQSKRKCLPLKPPIPSKFQGDMEKVKTANVPEFTSLVNFPAHMSQKQTVNLPEGMRCCVMCGQACPCSGASKKKGGNNKKSDGMLGDKNFAIIPTQNKGLCTACDVNVWVVCNSGLEIKWCKGCKNFRPWAAFGDKGLATKCLRCRERQREKYALQKEEKEKARLIKGAIKAK